MQLDKYPWMVALSLGSTAGDNLGGCGGTLIAANWVVTAAHCVACVGNECPCFSPHCKYPCEQIYEACTKDSLSVVLGEFDIASNNDIFDKRKR